MRQTLKPLAVAIGYLIALPAQARAIALQITALS